MYLPYGTEEAGASPYAQAVQAFDSLRAFPHRSEVQGGLACRKNREVGEAQPQHRHSRARKERRAEDKEVSGRECPRKSVREESKARGTPATQERNHQSIYDREAEVGLVTGAGVDPIAH